MRTTRYCLWGSHRRDVQVGSREDRQLQALARLAAELGQIGVALQTAVAPLFQGLAEAMSRLGETLGRFSPR